MAAARVLAPSTFPLPPARDGGHLDLAEQSADSAESSGVFSAKWLRNRTDLRAWLFADNLRYCSGLDVSKHHCKCRPPTIHITLAPQRNDRPAAMSRSHRECRNRKSPSRHSLAVPCNAVGRVWLVGVCSGMGLHAQCAVQAAWTRTGRGTSRGQKGVPRLRPRVVSTIY